MTPLYVVVGLVVAQRIGELAWSHRNERRLHARGAIEHGSAHYPLIVGLHAGWVSALVLFIPADREPDILLITLYALLQPVRYWAIVSLGEYWTTRILLVPGAVPVRGGPYRFLRHPNYLVVALEIPLLPAAFGAWMVAAAFGVVNVAILAHRIAVERAVRQD